MAMWPSVKDWPWLAKQKFYSSTFPLIRVASKLSSLIYVTNNFHFGRASLHVRSKRAFKRRGKEENRGFTDNPLKWPLILNYLKKRESITYRISWHSSSILQSVQPRSFTLCLLLHGVLDISEELFCNPYLHASSVWCQYDGIMVIYLWHSNRFPFR